MFDNTLNPHFVFVSFLRAGDEITTHIDRAIAAWQGLLGRDVVREGDVELLQPVRGAQSIRVDLWVDDFDASSCTYAFLCSSEDGNTPYARGERTIVSIGSKWSDAVRMRVSELRRDLRV